MLIGTHNCKTDTKGRVKLTAALKRQLFSVLQDGFVLKQSVYQECLELHPMNKWKVLMEKIDNLNPFIKKNVDFIRVFTAGVREIQIDASGRFVIPKDLKNYAGIDREVVLSSNAGIIEIWDKERYDAIISADSVDFQALSEEVMGGGNAIN